MQTASTISSISNPYGMLMPKRYKEWSGSNCVTTVQNVWVTLSNDSLALEYDPNTPKWYVVSLDNKIFNAEFSKSDEYGQPLPEGEDSTITILKMLYAGDGACASITDGIEASTTYSARLNITDLNREGSVEVDVVQIVDGGAVERLLSSQTITGTGIMDIDFTTETNDSVRVKIVLSEDMGDRDTAYVSLKLDKFSHPITLTHYYQALQPRLVTTCGEVKDLYRFGHNGQMKTNELAGIGNWYTALYWEYGTREAGRKNPDPKPSPSISPYAVFGGNPIWNSDVLGDVLKVANGSELYAKGASATLGQSDIRSLAKDKNGTDNSKYVNFKSDGTTYLDFGSMPAADQEKTIKNDKGLTLINDLINAKDEKGKDYVFSYIAGPQNNSISRNDRSIVESKGEIESISVTPKNIGLSANTVTPDDMPPNGFHGLVRIQNGTFYQFCNSNRSQAEIGKSDIKISRSSLVYHELRENWYRTVFKYPYKQHTDDPKYYQNQKKGYYQGFSGAHNSSVEDEGDNYGNPTPGGYSRMEKK